MRIPVALAVLCLTVPAAAQTTQPVKSDAPEAASEPQRDRPQRRQRSRRMVETPDHIELVQDVVYATAMSDAGQPVELTLHAAFEKQSDGTPMPVVVYIHGGGYSRGSKEQGLPFALAFAEGGYFAVTVGYRLSGVARYPGAVHDCKAAIRFLRANAEELGIDADRIGVWGHSAGGHLASLLAVTGNDPVLDGEVGEGGVASGVACACAVSGPADFTQPAAERAKRILSAWFGRGEQGLANAREASTIMYVDGEDPPMLLVHGKDDWMVPHRQAELLMEKLEAASVDAELVSLPGQGHTVTERRAYRRVASFFDEHLGGAAEQALVETVGRMLRGR